MKFVQEFRIIHLIFRCLIKGNHAVRQQAGKTAQRECMILVIGQFTVCRNHFRFGFRFRFFDQLRKPCTEIRNMRDRRTDRIVKTVYSFGPFRHAVYRRTEGVRQFFQGRISRVICLENLNGRNAGFQEGTVAFCPLVQIFLQVFTECGLSVDAVCAFGIPLPCKVHIVPAAAFQHRIADIAGFLPLRRKTVCQRLTGKVRIIECLCLFKRIRGSHGADPFKHHPVTGRNIFLLCAEHLRTHRLDIARHDNTDVVHEVAVVIAGNNGSGRMVFIQYDQAVLFRKQTQRIGLPVIGFCQ